MSRQKRLSRDHSRIVYVAKLAILCTLSYQVNRLLNQWKVIVCHH